MVSRHQRSAGVSWGDVSRCRRSVQSPVQRLTCMCRLSHDTILSSLARPLLVAQCARRTGSFWASPTSGTGRRLRAGRWPGRPRRSTIVLQAGGTRLFSRTLTNLANVRSSPLSVLCLGFPEGKRGQFGTYRTWKFIWVRSLLFLTFLGG